MILRAVTNKMEKSVDDVSGVVARWRDCDGHVPSYAERLSTIGGCPKPTVIAEESRDVASYVADASKRFARCSKKE